MMGIDKLGLIFTCVWGASGLGLIAVQIIKLYK